jgi:hypothetical protein
MICKKMVLRYLFFKYNKDKQPFQKNNSFTRAYRILNEKRTAQVWQNLRR